MSNQIMMFSHNFRGPNEHSCGFKFVVFCHLMHRESLRQCWPHCANVENRSGRNAEGQQQPCALTSCTRRSMWNKRVNTNSLRPMGVPRTLMTCNWGLWRGSAPDLFHTLHTVVVVPRLLSEDGSRDSGSGWHTTSSSSTSHPTLPLPCIAVKCCLNSRGKQYGSIFSITRFHEVEKEPSQRFGECNLHSALIKETSCTRQFQGPPNERESQEFTHHSCELSAKAPGRANVHVKQ